MPLIEDVKSAAQGRIDSLVSGEHMLSLDSVNFDAALDYAARGWPVFPLAPRDKVPLLSSREGGKGCHDATTDVKKLSRWWCRQTAANVGIGCGPADLAVVDVDSSNGARWLRWLEQHYDNPMPATPTARTRKGYHHYFRAPVGVKIPNAQNHPVKGIDIRAAGGYIVAPPSVHETGHVYQWVDGLSPADLGPPDMPAWLVELLRERQSEPVKVAPMRRVEVRDRYAQAALDSAAKTISSAANGLQQSTLTGQAYSIGRLVGSGLIPKADARATLIGAGMQMQSYGKPWQPTQIERQVDRKLAQGIANPRTVETRS